MSTIVTNNDIAGQLYRDLLNGLPNKSKLPRLIVVQHQVPNSLPLLQVLSEYFDIAAFVPKPKSRNASTHDALVSAPAARRIPILVTTRDEIDASTDPFGDLDVPADDRKVIILDIGGYFAKASSDPDVSSRIAAIIEDTENGHQKYEVALADSKIPFPIASVARSPLKDPEDFLVGQSILYSTENILRSNFSLLINRQALVIGYGKIGRSIASSLAARNINVWVYDKDPIKQAQSMAHGFRFYPREFAVANAGIIFCATGQKSLSVDDFKKVRKNTFIASVTSSDDEFDMTGFKAAFKEENGDGVKICTQREKGGTVFSLVNHGEAANFAHSNALGVYIYLVACEILFALRSILDNQDNFSSGDGICELNKASRSTVAEMWIKAYFGDGLE